MKAMKWVLALSLICGTAFGQAVNEFSKEVQVKLRLKLLDDVELYYGTDGDFQSRYNSSLTRYEMIDAAGNVMNTVVDTGTAGHLFATGEIGSGVIDSLYGAANIYGDSNITGGILRLYNAANEDTAVDLWKFAAQYDTGDLQIGTVGGTGGTRNWAIVDDATLATVFNGASFRLQIAGVDRLYLEASGQATFSAGINSTSYKVGGSPLSLFHLADMSNTGLADNKYMKWNAATGKAEWSSPSISATVATLDDVGDVTLTTPGSAHFLLRNAGNTAWINKAFSGAFTVDADGVATIANNAVALTAQTTGNYVATVTGSDRILVTGAAGEGTAITLDLPDDVATPGTYQTVTVDAYGRVTGGGTLGLDDLDNVTWGAPASGQVLSFNGTHAVWTDPTEVGPLASLQGIGDVGAYSGLAAGHLLISDGTNWYNQALSGPVSVTAGGVTAVDIGSGDLNDVDETGKADGKILAYDSGTDMLEFVDRIVADSVALGTHTTGNYVASVATGSGLSGGAAGSDGSGSVHTDQRGYRSGSYRRMRSRRRRHKRQRLREVRQRGEGVLLLPAAERLGRIRGIDLHVVFRHHVRDGFHVEVPNHQRRDERRLERRAFHPLNDSRGRRRRDRIRCVSGRVPRKFGGRCRQVGHG
jgi:hypothetical protein